MTKASGVKDTAGGEVSSSSSTSSVDSLFDDLEDEQIVASRTTPPVPGLYVFPDLLPVAAAQTSLAAIAAADHFNPLSDQCMLFTRPPPHPSSLPSHIQSLDATLQSLLAPHLPPAITELAFSQPLARQAILNRYAPGAGITPHIDLPRRYADGIVGVSLAGGCVMSFERVPEECMEGIADGGVWTRGGERHDVYLPPRSVYVLSGEARWGWAHGIAEREVDVVSDGQGNMTLPRGVRVSVTLRWLKDGAGLLA